MARSRRGAFTGFLLGGLLASLFMGNGLGSALLSWLALGFVLVLIVNFVRRRQAANAARQGRPKAEARSPR